LEATFHLGTWFPRARRASFRVAVLVIAQLSLMGMATLGGPGVAVAAGAETGSITGTVTDASTEAALEGIEVCAAGELGSEFPGKCTTTDSNGEYTLSELPKGEYEVIFSVPEVSSLNYLTQFYKGTANRLEATLVSVTAESKSSGIDAALQAGGEITGKVTDASTKAAVEGIEVCAFTRGEVIEEVIEELRARCATTDSSGEYTITSLASGEYTVSFSSSAGGYLPQYYNEKASSPEADPVSVTAGSPTSAINAALQPEEQPEGPAVVTQAASAVTDTGATLNATVNPNGSEVSECKFEYGTSTAYGESVPCTPAPSSGSSPVAVSASIAGLTPNTTYHFRIAASNETGTSEGTDETFETLAASATGEITGVVSDAATKAAVEGIEVCAFTSEVIVRCATTDSSGEYTITSLASGEYTVSFSSSTGSYLTQYYNQKADSSEADPVPVTAESTSSAINAALSKAPTATEEADAINKRFQEQVAALQKLLEREFKVTQPLGAATNAQKVHGATTISSAQIASLLASQLTPSGKSAKIASLLKAGGFTFLFKALQAGTAKVGWYRVPPGAKLANKTKAKPILIASGKLTFTAAGTAKMKVALTAAGKHMLKHAKRVKVTAKGTFTPTGMPPINATRSFVLKR
jgi:hypothetical protein